MDVDQIIAALDRLIAMAATIESLAQSAQTESAELATVEQFQNTYQEWNQSAYQLLPSHLQQPFYEPYTGKQVPGILGSNYKVAMREFVTNPQHKSIAPTFGVARGRQPEPEEYWTYSYKTYFEQLFRSQVMTLKEAREFYRYHKPSIQASASGDVGVLSSKETERLRTVFIGHGHSDLYLRVVRFLERKLSLKVVFFEDEPRGGYSNIEVLEDMLSQAAFAVIIATGDDTASDGEAQARLNVIHEIGLCQGRYGFKKVAVMRQEGVKEFSNLAGYQELRFTANDINAKFEELRGMLEREGIRAEPLTEP